MRKKKKKIERYTTISLKVVKRMLGFESKGFRSVLEWCKKKKITVFGEGHRKRILESEWAAVQEKEFADAIRQRYPKTWVEELAKRGIQVIQSLTEMKTEYQPISEHAKRILKGEGYERIENTKKTKGKI